MGIKRSQLDPALALDMQKVLAAIEDERARRGLSYAQVCRELGTAYRTLFNWREGRSGMNADVALRVSVWLRTDLRKFARQPDPLPETRGAAA